MATSIVAGTLDKVLATTASNWMPTIQLQVYNSTPLIQRIIKNGNKKPWMGESQRITLASRTYKTATRYTNYGTADTTPQEPMTAADYEMVGYMQAVTLSRMQLRKNRSNETKMIDMVKAETQLAAQSIRDLMETDLVATTQATNGLITLDTLTDASTTIAGVAGSSTWGGTTTASGGFAGQGLNDMLTLRQTLGQYAALDGAGGAGITSGDMPDLVYTTQLVERAYFNELQPQMRFTTSDALDTGASLAWFSNPLISSAFPAAGRLYMVNTRHLYLWVAPDGDFAMTDEVSPTNQDAWTKLIVWNGQFGTTQRRKHGKLTAITA